MIKLSVVVPCYNEEKNIPLLIEKFSEAIYKRKASDEIEVVLVNNGSTDNSSTVFNTLLPRYKFVKLVTIGINNGYGFGFIQGLNACSGEYIGWTHADLQTDPNDVLKAFEIIKKDNSNNLFIKGSRRGRSIYDNFFTLGMSIFESIFLFTHLYEINAQPNIFPKAFFKCWQEPPYDFSLDLYVYYLSKKHKLKQVRFSVSFPSRLFGVSKWNTGLKSKLSFVKRTIKFSYELRKRGIK